MVSDGSSGLELVMEQVDVSDWERVLSENLSQRERELPPSWVRVAGAGKIVYEKLGHVYVSGTSRVMANEIVRIMNEAREMLVVCSFLLADEAVENALLQAAQRKVRVYVLLASEARLGKEAGGGEFDRKVLEEHKAMLRRLGGWVMFRSAEGFHAKVVVADPWTTPTGILLTANLTKEALGRNEELGVQLTASEVRAVAGHLRWAMWEAAEHEVLDGSRFQVFTPLGKIEPFVESLPVVATTAHVNSIRAEALRLISQARSSIVISSFGWDVNHEVVQLLCRRAREGLDVTVLCRIRPVSMKALLALAEAGAKVLGFRWLHAKAIWTDSGEAMLMSANIESDGLDKGFELGVVLKDYRAHAVRDCLTDWQGAAQWQLVHSPKLGSVEGDIQMWQEGRLVDASVLRTADVDLGRVTADSADALWAPRPAFSPDSLPFAHELVCRWRVIAPALPASAIEQKKEIVEGNGEVSPAELVSMGQGGKKGKRKTGASQHGGRKHVSWDPPVYRIAGGALVVAIRSMDDLSRASDVMREAGATAIVRVA